MIKSVLFLLTLCFLIFNTNAQEIGEYPDEVIHSCASDEIFNDKLQENPFLQQIVENKEALIKHYLDSIELHGSNSPESGPLTIPVVVYIVHENGVENITDAQVISQINILNTYFASYDLKFCLATKKGTQDILTINSPAGVTSSTAGIFHYENSTLTDHSTNDHNALTATGSALSADNYLKIWVVKRIAYGNLPPFVKVLGYSMFPQFSTLATDGVVMSYDVFGDITTCACTTLDPNYNTGKILVHEVGHYLGLYHTFEGGCAGMSTSNCATQGDRICDTPPVASPNNNCPNGVNTCSESPDLPDNINNYMDYTAESCKNQFTPGQKSRMFAIINMYRSNLVSSSNLAYTGTTCNGNVVSDFTGDNFNPCIGTTVNFSAVPATGVTYSWDFGDGNTATGQNVSHTYTSQHMPTSVVLTVSDGTNSVASTKLIYVDSCPPIDSPNGVWYVSNKGGINFATGAPVYDNGSYINNNWITEACAAQSNAQGQLLFYTDGERLWDQNHWQFNNSNLLDGKKSSHHGVLSVQDPGNPNEYYLFTKNDAMWINGTLVVDSIGYRYSKIAINGTQASTTSNWNIPITLPNNLGYSQGIDNAIFGGEGITAVKSCDGWWILTTAVKGNDYYIVVHSLTANGFSFHGDFLSPYHSPQQAIKASKNGKKLALGSGTISSNQNSGLTTYKFDTYTGTISNPTTIITGEKIYGIAFSPDARLLYTTAWGWDGIYQHDLESPNPAQSGRMVALSGAAGAEIQRGPNDKIYLTRSSSLNLQVIHQPNQRNTAALSNECQHSFDGPLMETNISSGGIPNMIDAREEFVFGNMFTYTQTDCITYDFSPSICSNVYAWDFGDPASGSNNTSTQTTPTHIFSGPGVYTVSVTGNGTTLTDTIEIGTQSTIQGANTICLDSNSVGNYSTNLQPGQTALWTVTGGWITGLNFQTNATVTWVTLPGTVTVTVMDTATNCESTSSITVTEVCSTNDLADLSKIKFNVFPNPSKGTINITFDGQDKMDGTIRLKTYDGKLISKKKISGNSNALFEIPRSQSNGVLFVELEINGSTYTEKVILMR